jgi:ABC-type sugar transport system permease subunit
MKKRTRKALIGYSFISLWLFGFLALMVYPLVNSIIYSFSKVTITGSGIKLEFLGFANFISIFTTEEGFKFGEALIAFPVELILYVPIILVFSIIISILLNSKIKLRGFFRSVYFLPVIISSGPVINELISQGAGGTSFIESYGVITMIEQSLPTFIATPLISVFREIIIIFWFSGVQILIFLAGLQKIDPSIYEASSIDGAGPWEAFWKITLPSLKNLVFINAIYTIVTLSTFSENNVITIIKSNMFNPKTGYGFASALSWTYFIVVSLFLLIATLLFKPKKEEIH